MKRFMIRNYGPSRQVPYKDQTLYIAYDSVIETDDVSEAAVLMKQERMHLTDRGEEFAASVPPKELEQKEHQVTVDDAEAVHAENFPDEQHQETGGTQPTAPDEAKDEIAYVDMTVKELTVLAKDRQLKTSGLKKAELIEALEDYDTEEVPDKPVEPVG